MSRFVLLLLAILSLYSCKQNPHPIDASPTRFSLYSQNVKDSFTIFVELPENYSKDKKYPVVYLLDADFYFDILIPSVKKYTALGGLTPAILVGVGYGDLKKMDSLRNRDFTYPSALPKYEMNPSGGGDKFLKFISGELIPFVGKNYNVQKNKRTLFGHSLAGYFTLFALYQHLAGQDSSFSNYIAASPSLDYNDQYLLHQLHDLSSYTGSDTLRTYLTFGGLEDTEDADDTASVKCKDLLESFSASLSKLNSGLVQNKTDTFGNLGHMETPYPTFMRGLAGVLPAN